MQITINWTENKVTDSGKEYKKITTTDGVTASAWKNQGEEAWYEEIMPGATIEGELVTKGKYTNLVSGNKRPHPRQDAPGRSQTSGSDKVTGDALGAVKAAQERDLSKQQYDQKKSAILDANIKFGDAFRASSLFLSYAHDYPEELKEEAYQEIWKWQKRFLTDIKEDPQRWAGLRMTIGFTKPQKSPSALSAIPVST